jgi:DNA polymerase I
MIGLRTFTQIWLVDFEFTAPPGDRPEPICLVALELVSGRTKRISGQELKFLAGPPYAIGHDSLFVAFYASAEIGCHLALGWPVPANILDLFVEFRNSTNGQQLPCGNGLLGALTFYGLDGISVVEKKEMRDLALRGGPYTIGEHAALLDYCQSDVIALKSLLHTMESSLDMPRALLRGQFMAAAARMEYSGVPIDIEKLLAIREHWDNIQLQLISKVDADYGVYDGSTFKRDRWAAFLAKRGIAWPQLSTGNLALDDATFREMAQLHPIVEPIRLLRIALSELRLEDLAVGRDGRNRSLLSAFRARTGRNQPSNSKFIFGPSAWVRSLIKPDAGYGLAYIDWSQQEFAIAAALSHDPAMMLAYQSGDPYLSFAKQAGAIPPDGTKASHGRIREQFKQCVLAVQYGMGDVGLAQRIGQPTAIGRDLIRLHHKTYPIFWKWSDRVVDFAMLNSRLFTVFGWNLYVGRDANSRSLRNFPMQANGAEMLRLACCLATKRGIKVCAPVHDAILIEAPLLDIEAAVETAQKAMVEASSIVLDGFELRSEAKIFRYPDRYEDERGKKMWDTVIKIIGDLNVSK